jgi:hypothetical protein
MAFQALQVQHAATTFKCMLHCVNVFITAPKDQEQLRKTASAPSPSVSAPSPAMLSASAAAPKNGGMPSIGTATSSTYSFEVLCCTNSSATIIICVPIICASQALQVQHATTTQHHMLQAVFQPLHYMIMTSCKKTQPYLHPHLQCCQVLQLLRKLA